MKKYITYNEKLRKGLNAFSFKQKNKNSYLREEKDSSIELFFTHSTHGEKHVKYYHVNVSIRFNEIHQIKEKGDFYIGIVEGISMDLGHLMGNAGLKEFRLAEEDDESQDNLVAEEILLLIEKYAVPFIERYRTPQNLLEDYEKGILIKHLFVSKEFVPFLYLICGHPDKALAFAERKLEELRIKDAETPPLRIEEKDLGNAHVTTYHVKGMELQMYEELFEHLKEYTSINEQLNI